MTAPSRFMEALHKRPKFVALESEAVKAVVKGEVVGLTTRQAAREGRHGPGVGVIRGNPRLSLHYLISIDHHPATMVFVT